MSEQTIYIIIMAVATCAVTVGLRAFPFLLFGSGKKCPPVIAYIGKVLSPAAIAMLVIYCWCSTYSNSDFLSSGAGIPELAASLVTVGLHLYKRNPLLSIICGTAVYMILVQKIF